MAKKNLYLMEFEAVFTNKGEVRQELLKNYKSVQKDINNNPLVYDVEVNTEALDRYAREIEDINRRINEISASKELNNKSADRLRKTKERKQSHLKLDVEEEFFNVKEIQKNGQELTKQEATKYIDAFKNYWAKLKSQKTEKYYDEEFADLFNDLQKTFFKDNAEEISRDNIKEKQSQWKIEREQVEAAIQNISNEIKSIRNENKNLNAELEYLKQQNRGLVKQSNSEYNRVQNEYQTKVESHQKKTKEYSDLFPFEDTTVKIDEAELEAIRQKIQSYLSANPFSIKIDVAPEELQFVANQIGNYLENISITPNILADYTKADETIKSLQSFINLRSLKIDLSTDTSSLDSVENTENSLNNQDIKSNSIQALINDVDTLAQSFDKVSISAKDNFDKVKEEIVSLQAEMQKIGIDTIPQLVEQDAAIAELQNQRKLLSEEQSSFLKEKIDLLKQIEEKTKEYKDAEKKANEAMVKSNEAKEKVPKNLTSEDITAGFNKTQGASLVGKITELDGGFLRFTANVQTAEDQVEQFIYTVDKADKTIKVFNENGSIDKNFLKSHQGISKEQLTQFDTAAKRYIQFLRQKNDLERTDEQLAKMKVENPYGYDEYNKQYQKVTEGLIKQEEILNKIGKDRKLTESEILAFRQKVTELNKHDVKNFAVSKKSDVNKRDNLIFKYQDFMDGFGNTDDLYDNLIDKSIKLQNETIGIKQAFIGLTTEADNLVDQLGEGDFLNSEEFNEKYNRLNEILKKLKEITAESNLVNSSKGKVVASQNMNLQNATEFDKKSLISETFLSTYDDVNIKRRVGDNVYEIELLNKKANTLTKAKIALEGYATSNKQAATAVRILTEQESKNLSFSERWTKGLREKINNLSQYITGAEMINKAWAEIKQGMQFIVDLNASMTTVYQTMDITTEGLKELSSGAISAAKDLGAMSSQMIDAIEIYAAYGKTVDEILNQAKPTVMLANAAGIDAKTASDQIQGVLQQYEELEGQEMRIVNSYEKIAANVQIDFDKAIAAQAEGVQTAGAVARDAGLEFEKLAAIIATTSETTRQEGKICLNM